MATRSDLRGLLKQSQKNSSADARGRIHSRKESDDEVVKYMSKLPAYLQGEESNVALNVGVLDWGRLEKWKHHGRADRKVSSTTTLGTLPKASSSSHHVCKIDDGKVKASRDLQPSSVHGVRCTLVPELPSRDSLNKQEIATSCSYKSSARVKNPGKSRRSHSSSMGNPGGSLGAKETGKRAGEVVHAQEARDRDSDAGLTLEKQESPHISNIVLLRSRKQSLSSEPHMSSLVDDPQVAREVNRSLDFTSLGLRSESPRSCPFSVDLERDSDDMKLPLLGVALSAKKEPSGGTARHSKTASTIFDQQIQQDKKRHHSPSKRFSCSFGRLSRSFTFKEEDSSSPLTSSDDDTSMRFDGPSQPEEKHYCGSRVSPLRRLLDPLLRSKVSQNVLPSEARSSSSFNQDEKKKQDASRTRALLQLTIRNGIPMFQFVVDDDKLKSRSRSILGATMKSSASSFKDDSVQYCTFYSVNEVKKKRSWLIHGHKEKQQQQHKFFYNVIGEMRLCNSINSDNISSVMRESVLVDESEQVVKGRKEVAAVVIKKKNTMEENFIETTVVIPGGVHSIPEKGAPTPLISRWRSGGCCDCGGWDVGCKLHVLLSNKITPLHELDHKSFRLFVQKESDKNSGPVLEMTELKTGMYRVEFGSFLSHLQAFFVCVTVVTCASEEETVSKTIGKSSSPFAPPLSPVGRA